MASTVVELHQKVQSALDTRGPDAAINLARQGMESFSKAGDRLGEVMAMIAVSECQLGMGEQDSALTTAKDAFEIAKGLRSDRKAEASALLAIANATLFKDSSAAVAKAKEAMDLFIELKDNRGRAAALVTISNGEAVAEKAKQAAKDALDLFGELGDKRNMGAALHARMNAESMAAGPEAGLAASAATLRLAKEIGSKKAEVAALNSIASLQLVKDNPEEVMKVAAEALSLAKDMKDSSAYMSTLTNIFTVQLSKEQPHKAVDAAREGLELFREIGDKRGQAHMLKVLAAVQIQGQEFTEALRSARKALELYKELKDRAGVLSALNQVITIYGSSKPIEPLLMLEVAKEGIVYFKDSGDKRGVAAALHLDAAVQYATHTKKGESKEAKRRANAAIAFYKDLQSKEGEVAVLQTMMFASLSRELPDEALNAAQEILSIHQNSGDKCKEIGAMDTIANLHLSMDSTRRALKVSYEALTIATSLGDVKAQLGVMNTIAQIHLVRSDPRAACKAAEEMLGLFGQLGDQAGMASAMTMMYRVHLMMGNFDDAMRVADQTLAIMRDLGDMRGQLSVLEVICYMLHERKMYAEALELSKEALEIARHLGLRYSEAAALFLVAKSNIGSKEGLGSAAEAAKIFKELGFKRAAGVSLHAAANGCLMQRMPKEALATVNEGLEIFREVQDKAGEAVMLHTMANCHLAARDKERSVATAYEALQLFGELGDEYGKNLAKKLLVSAGQTEEEIAERRAQQKASFESLQIKDAGESQEEKLQMEHEAHVLQDTNVLWEHAWTNLEMEDPKVYGEKRTGGPRKLFVTSKLQSQGLLSKLMTAKVGKGNKSVSYFANTLNGRFQTVQSMQAAMQASKCASVVYDVSKLNVAGPLEVIDLTLKLVQAMVPLNEPRVAMDFITSSCQHLAFTNGLREPFHAGLYGFCRTARIENPQHEFRLLDIDAGTREDDMHVITRFVMGSQQSRPIEVLVRNHALLTSRLVGSRVKLNQPVRVEVMNTVS